MLKDITDFFSDLVGGDKEPARFTDGDYRLASAALLVHVATLDGALTDSERERLGDLVQRRFGLDDDATAELIDSAVAADREAIDFYQFTSAILRAVDVEGRHRIIAMMWEMAYADGAITEFEDNVLWRVADLLGLSGRDRVELRREVAERLGLSSGG